MIKKFDDFLNEEFNIINDRDKILLDFLNKFSSLNVTGWIAKEDYIINTSEYKDVAIMQLFNETKMEYERNILTSCFNTFKSKNFNEEFELWDIVKYKNKIYIEAFLLSDNDDKAEVHKIYASEIIDWDELVEKLNICYNELKKVWK